MALYETREIREAMKNYKNSMIRDSPVPISWK